MSDREVIDRAQNLMEWFREQAKRHMLYDKRGKVETIVHEDGKRTLVGKPMVREAYQSITELLPRLHQIDEWRMSAYDKRRRECLVAEFENLIKRMKEIERELGTKLSEDL